MLLLLGACTPEFVAPPDEPAPGASELDGLVAGSGAKQAGRLSLRIDGPLVAGSAAGGEVAAEATLVVGVVTSHLTGSFDAAASELSLGGEGYTLHGTVTGGGLVGTYLGPAGNGTFSTLPPAQELRLLCGTVELGGTEGALGLLVAGDGAARLVYGHESGSGTGAGTLTGEALALQVGEGGSATGTLVSGTASGRFFVEAVEGSFTAVAGACPGG